MDDRELSLTAYSVALCKAAHQLFDDPRVLHDPLAVRIIGPMGAKQLRLSRRQFMTRQSQELRAFFVARARIAEDALNEAVARGVQQYVILGAGLDTFGYRSRARDGGLSVFEVDTPGMQGWKQKQLVATDIEVPDSTRFVPLNVESATLLDVLRAAGFRPDQAAVFSCLGLIMYLSPVGVGKMLQQVAQCLGGGGEVVLDYALAAAHLNFLRRRSYRLMIADAAAVGEPWLTFFDPASIAGKLGELGYSQIEDIGPDEINGRLFRGRSDGLLAARHARVVTATRPARSFPRVEHRMAEELG
jgi:methyltransferase (TIGR00027 family)